MIPSRKNLLIAVSLLCLVASDAQRVSPPTPSIDVAATYPAQAVRLRKLHLVRPDLIPYPIAYEVVC